MQDRVTSLLKQRQQRLAQQQHLQQQHHHDPSAPNSPVPVYSPPSASPSTARLPGTPQEQIHALKEDERKQQVVFMEKFQQLHQSHQHQQDQLAHMLQERERQLQEKRQAQYQKLLAQRLSGSQPPSAAPSHSPSMKKLT
jgi:4-diphosphocytidyl-2C-methyl-D-erythritol kinase